MSGAGNTASIGRLIAREIRSGNRPKWEEKALILPLKGIYFDQIKAGEKVLEYGLVTPFWQKRLQGQTFSKIILTRGYPKRDDLARRMERKWKGFTVQTITHEHFGPSPVSVFAIDVSEPSNAKMEARK